MVIEMTEAPISATPALMLMLMLVLVLVLVLVLGIITPTLIDEDIG